MVMAFPIFKISKDQYHQLQQKVTDSERVFSNIYKKRNIIMVSRSKRSFFTKDYIAKMTILKPPWNKMKSIFISFIQHLKLQDTWWLKCNKSVTRLYIINMWSCELAILPCDWLTTNLLNYHNNNFNLIIITMGQFAKLLCMYCIYLHNKPLLSWLEVESRRVDPRDHVTLVTALHIFFFKFSSTFSPPQTGLCGKWLWLTCFLHFFTPWNLLKFLWVNFRFFESKIVIGINLGRNLKKNSFDSTQNYAEKHLRTNSRKTQGILWKKEKTKMDQNPPNSAVTARP